MIYVRTDDAAEALGMSPSTVKKYYLLVEQHGYRFKRSQEGHVLFTENDIQLFKKLIQVKNQKGMTLPKAVEQVISSITDVTVITDEVMTSTTDITSITGMTEDISQIKEIILKQNQMLMAQQEQINSLLSEQQQSKKLIESNSSKRDELLMQSIRETQEVKKMLAAATQESKKKWWQKLF
ncbi:DUF3967 domain-containing protein [Bacillus wiedmannii]|uniref:DUF3967 domain-containing protein n=1 Tax=Bacillus wiedmannii TaxID=1890302 RepID=UPI0014839254|nr:DUF3967 domain-containing protein [Bacillus wiedmannii]